MVIFKDKIVLVSKYFTVSIAEASGRHKHTAGSSILNFFLNELLQVLQLTIF